MLKPVLAKYRDQTLQQMLILLFKWCRHQLLITLLNWRFLTLSERNCHLLIVDLECNIIRVPWSCIRCYQTRVSFLPNKRLIFKMIDSRKMGHLNMQKAITWLGEKLNNFFCILCARFFCSPFWNKNGQNIKCARSFVPHSYSGEERTPFHPFYSQGQNKQNVVNAFSTNHSHSRIVNRSTRS